MQDSGGSFDVCVNRVLEHEGGYVNHQKPMVNAII